MSESGRCAGCGAEALPEVSSNGLCPTCLLKLGLSDHTRRGDGDPTNTAPGGATPGPRRMIAHGQQFGPYRVERLLGRGGMGEVYEAVDETGRRLALKVLTHGIDEPDDRTRFLREGRLAASVSHPHTVYIYGTDEVEGVPVIAMELAPGGSLKDRVRNEGPLAPAAAVDAILEVISGLEAAAAAGVLHRDVKPSNCFVDSEGRVKVGDFGLSISTLAKADRDLTLTGAFLGTPAFASPEQLRSDDLDVRSDIYSVGATLYYLLTGRPPFEEENILRLASLIAQEPPPALGELRPDSPAGLAAVVMRCLAKQPGDRFKGYSALAKALEAFGSSAPRPASVGSRLAAGLVDWFVLGMLLAPVAVCLEWILIQWPANLSVGALHFGYTLVGVAYFTAMEGCLGRSVGKALLGLRVRAVDRSAPGLARALVRGTLFVLAMRVPSVFGAPEGIAPAHPPLSFDLGVSGAGLTLGFNVSGYWYAGLVILFVTMRRRNGFSGLHDLLTRTRVVVGSTEETPKVAPSTADALSGTAPIGRIGPYQVVEHLNDRLLRGYDGRLRREVWLRLHPSGTPALPPRRRDLSRPGRLHWLTGKRAADGCWDAYEAVEGSSLVALLATPQPWSRVRHWLYDLAAELGAGLDDQTVPDLSLDRVWITRDGRAKLLDWRAPGAEGGESEPAQVVVPAAVDQRAAQEFLGDVASSALLGRFVRGERGVASPASPLPLSARGFLEQLSAGACHSLGRVVQVLGSLTAGPAEVGRTTRWTHLAICGALPALAWIYFVPGFFQRFEWQAQHPERADLATCVDELQSLKQYDGAAPPPEELERIGLGDVEIDRIKHALEIHVAQRLRAARVDPSSWDEPFMRREWRAIAAAALAARPSPSVEEIDDASRIVSRFLENRRESAPSALFSLGLSAVGIPLTSLTFLAALGVLSAALFRGGLLFRLLGVGVVDGSGRETSSVRASVRAMIAWSPFVILDIPVFLVLRAMEHSGAFSRGPWLSVPWLVFVVLPAAVLATVAWSARNPRRGLQDRLAGTHLVPR
jgi:hypothetical protein